MITLPSDWSEFLRLLSAHRVRFLIVGAHALAANGRPRATQHLDVFVEPTVANAAHLGRALEAFGFTKLAAAAGAFAQPDRMATLGREPLRIDVMTSITGVTFREAWRGRLRVDLGGIELGVLGRREPLGADRFTHASAVSPTRRPSDVLVGRVPRSREGCVTAIELSRNESLRARPSAALVTRPSLVRRRCTLCASR